MLGSVLGKPEAVNDRGRERSCPVPRTCASDKTAEVVVPETITSNNLLRSGWLEGGTLYQDRGDAGAATLPGRDFGVEGSQKEVGHHPCVLGPEDGKLPERTGQNTRRLLQDDALRHRVWLISAVRAMLACGVIPNE